MVEYVCHVVLIPFQWKLVFSYDYTRDGFVLKTAVWYKEMDLIRCFKVI
jgi:hypothetical protein